MIESIIKRIPLLSDISFKEIKIHNLSGLTNKNYLLSTTGNQYILRVPRDSTNGFINRTNESYNSEIAQQLGLAPKTLWRGEGGLTGASLSEYINHASNLEISDAGILQKLASTLATLYKSKKTFKGTMSNKEIAKHLQQYFELCTLKQQQSLITNYKKALSLLELQLSDRPAVPSHFDLVIENILLQDNKLWLIDWEYSAMASPFWDIATLCNAGNFDSEKSEHFSKMVLKNTQKEDIQSLKDYRFIVKTISTCWQTAFNN